MEIPDTHFLYVYTYLASEADSDSDQSAIPQHDAGNHKREFDSWVEMS